MRTKSTFILISIFFFLLIFIDCSVASIQSEEVVVTSTGRTIDEAVIKGLVEAIRQKRGVEIDSLEEIYFSLESLFHREGKEEFYKDILKDSVINEVFMHTMHTNRLVEKYELLSRNRLNDGSWEAKIRVFVPVYRKVESNHRSTLAVLPFIPLQELKYTDGLDITEIARQITQHLTTRLVQTRHYNILDREYGNQFDKESQLIMSGGFPLREMARLEEQLGADYLIIGTISDVKSSVYTQEWYGKYITRCQIFLRIDVRAVEFATRQVHRADTVTTSIDKVIDLRETSGKTKQIPGDLILELVDDVIIKLNRGFLDILLPVRVLDIQNGTVYLNQGGSRIRSGEKFSIMDTHRSIKDPGSGALIGIEREKIAVIMIKEVMEEYSVADIVSGEVDRIIAGLRCNRLP